VEEASREVETEELAGVWLVGGIDTIGGVLRTLYNTPTKQARAVNTVTCNTSMSVARPARTVTFNRHAALMGDECEDTLAYDSVISSNDMLLTGRPPAGVQK
jgi:hypothetical protein